MAWEKNRLSQHFYSDPFYKVRPQFDALNTAVVRYFENWEYSVEEVIIPYFERHGAKQYIMGKPVASK